jgi:hypothetical protein
VSAVHSIWLMPDAGDEALLQSDVDELARRFQAPRFRPHLTLVEDMERDAGGLAPLAEAIAAGLAPFAAPVREIAVGELWFRSFYALFENAGPLRELKRRAIARIAPGALDGFMPHVSLLYGAPDGPERRAAQSMMQKRHAGRRIRFDRVAVVTSGRDIPVADWAVRFAAPLGGGTPAPRAAAP